MAKVTNALNPSVAHLRRPPCRGQCAKKTGKATFAVGLRRRICLDWSPQRVRPRLLAYPALPGSSPGEFANATADDRQVEVIRIE